MVASTPQSRKQKGRKFQQDIRDDIQNISPRLTLNDVRSTSMGAQGVDIQLSGVGIEEIPFAIECKRKEAMNVHGDYIQAKEHAKKEKLLPLLVSKRNHESALVHLEWDVFKIILTRLNKVESELAALKGTKIQTLATTLLKK